MENKQYFRTITSIEERSTVFSNTNQDNNPRKNLRELLDKRVVAAINRL